MIGPQAWKDVFDLSNDGHYRGSGQGMDELEAQSVADDDISTLR